MSKLNLLAMSVTKNSEAKSTWQSTLATHMLKTHVFLVTSNLESLHAFIIHYRSACEGESEREISDRKMMTPNAGVRQQRMMEHLNSYHLR